MNCTLCGEVCRCHSEPLPSALPQLQADATCQGDGVAEAETLSQHPSDGESAAPTEVVTAEESTGAPDSDAWRDEISARLNRFRSRRKIRPPRYPSLKLPFAPIEASPRIDVPSVSSPTHVFETVSNHALALEMRQEAVEPHTEAQYSSEAAPRIVNQPAAHSGAQIIEFPRFSWGPPPLPPDQLAEPVSERPRILEVPEIAPPPPALGGRTRE